MPKVYKALLALTLPLLLASWACLNIDIGNLIGDSVEEAMNQVLDSLELDDLRTFANWVKENADKVSNVRLVEGGFAFDAEVDIGGMASTLKAIADSGQLTERVDLAEAAEGQVKLVFEGQEVGKAIVMELTTIGEGMTGVAITVEDMGAQ